MVLEDEEEMYRLSEFRPTNHDNLNVVSRQPTRGSLDLLSTATFESRPRPLTQGNIPPEILEFTPLVPEDHVTPLSAIATPPSGDKHLTPLTRVLVVDAIMPDDVIHGITSVRAPSPVDMTRSKPMDTSTSVPLSTRYATDDAGVAMATNPAVAMDTRVTADEDGDDLYNVAAKPYDLPPCKVCADKGTGFHYGVNTCEACKGFFRRSLLRDHDYTCKKNQHCQLRPNRRRMCPSCRLEKCLAVGMSKDGIKTGRYSAEKKLTDMHAVRQLKAEQAMAAEQLDDQRKETDVVELVTTIVEARHRIFKDWDVYDKELAEMQQQFMMRWSRDGHSLQGMTIEDMFKQLGTDEKEVMFNRIFSGIEDAVHKEIKFAKAIPGFKELVMEDQVALCKVALSEIRILDRYKWFDQESRSVTTDRSPAILDIVPIFGEEFADVAFKVAKRLVDLKLTEEESSVLVALAMFGTDRCELLAPEKVQCIQDRLVEALQWLLKKNHPGNVLILPHLVSVLTELRPLQDFAKATLNDVLAAKVDSRILQVPPVFWEVVSST